MYTQIVPGNFGQEPRMIVIVFDHDLKRKSHIGSDLAALHVPVIRLLRPICHPPPHLPSTGHKAALPQLRN